MKEPTITIGVTAHNAEQTILAALQSALDQSVPIHQIVVVDDASTDGTMEALGKFEHLPNVEVHQIQENSGVAVTRNEIIKRATGDFLAFFDDDDISSPDRVVLQRQRILDYERNFAEGAPVICHTARLQIYPDKTERVENTMGTWIDSVAPCGPPVVRRALIGEPLKDAYGSCATCSQMARTEVYRMMGGFDDAFRRCEDSDFAVRLGLKGGHFVGLSEPLVTQKMTATSDKSIDALRHFSLLLLEKHEAVFDNPSQYRFCRAWTGLKFTWLAGRRSAFVREIIAIGLTNPVQTTRRIVMALPNYTQNSAFRRFQGGVG